MKLEELYEQIITEAPIPDSWNADVFTNPRSFKSMIDYAKERAQQVGRGSSRVAFEIPYKGRRSVIKISLNNKGLLQTEEEANLMSDWYVKSIGNVIPIIDYDERSSRPTWIHTEFADKITQKQLERFFDGVPMRDITMHLDSQHGRSRGFNTNPLPEKLFENENYRMLEELVGNFGIPAGDFSRKANWGLYKGTPVIIDLGYTEQTQKLYR